MIYQVLEKPDEFFNDNILGKFYTKDFEAIEFKIPWKLVIFNVYYCLWLISY